MKSENEPVKNIVTSYRLSEDTKGKLQQQLKDLGLTQEQYFNKVVSLMEVENVKQNSFLSRDTTIIQSNLDAILNSFINISDCSNNLINNKEAELEELKAKYKDMLLNKENSITEAKQEFQQAHDNLDLIKIENEDHKNELLSIRIEYTKQLEQLESNLTDKASLINEYKIKNDDLLGIVSEYKRYKPQVEEFKKLLADAQTKNISINDIVKDKDLSINELTKVIEKLHQDNQKEMVSLQKENELNIRLAVAEVKEQLNNKLNQDQQKHNVEIEEYQTKYKTLLGELAKPKVARTNIKNNNSATVNSKQNK